MIPAALFFHLRIDLAQPGPNPQMAIPDHQARRTQAPLLEVAQDRGPTRRGFPGPRHHRQHHFPSITQRGQDHEESRLVFLQACLHVDAINPAIHSLDLVEGPALPVGKLALPFLLQSSHRVKVKGEHRCESVLKILFPHEKEA